MQVIELKQRGEQYCEDFHNEIGEMYGYDDIDFFEEGAFCAGAEEGKDACAGDSGSAIVVKERSTDKVIQVGIVSGGVGKHCGSKDAPTYYTRVSFYRKWILDNLM